MEETYPFFSKPLENQAVHKYISIYSIKKPSCLAGSQKRSYVLVKSKNGGDICLCMNIAVRTAPINSTKW